ncbi:hypothetical protein GGX14DRAFT_384451 [Mycena pura]|uniref:Uncharacterized protein n=1 Tax=Mycena pura TaxID=153505 RepID=A0AAD6YVF6_9AGAR|nr:hypothetical protein GGX14DRAFT_384451 [Mycena pura]
MKERKVSVLACLWLCISCSGQEALSDFSHEAFKGQFDGGGARIVAVKPGRDAIVAEATNNVCDLFVGGNLLQQEVIRAVVLKLAQLALGGLALMEAWQFRCREVERGVARRQHRAGAGGEIGGGVRVVRGHLWAGWCLWVRRQGRESGGGGGGDE